MTRLNKQSLRDMIISEMKNILIQSQLPDIFYKSIETAIYGSDFLSYPNDEESLEFNTIGGEDWEQTDAAAALGVSLQYFFDNIGFPITIVVRSPDPDLNPTWILNPGHRAYPNRILIGGEQSISSRGRFVMYLNLAIFGDDFDISDINITKAVQDAAHSIRHELIHISQFEKRKTKQKISRLAAKRRFEDEGEIGDPRDRPKYLSSRIEIDAYAHQFAEELLSKYGKNKSLNILRGMVDLKSLDLSDELKEYLLDFSDVKLLNVLRGKIYSRIIDFTERGIYEIKKKRKGKSKSRSEKTYMKGTEKNLYLDQPSTHGGWPEGEYDPPVMKRIANWFKDMEMIDEDDDQQESVTTRSKYI